MHIKYIKRNSLKVYFSKLFSMYSLISRGPSWPWSYGSRNCNYLFNQCLSPPMLCVRISIRARCTTLCDKVCQVGGFLRVLRFPPPIKLTAMI